MAYKFITKKGAIPAFLGYKGFPASICVSKNEEVVHGIPSREKILKEGDIVSIDVGVLYNGYYGDVSITVPVGKISDEAERLIEITKLALYKSIENMVSGKRLGDVSYAIQKSAESNGYNVVRDYVGHGIGKKLHEEPAIPNFGQPGEGIRLKPGMVLAPEPMLNIGTSDVKVLSDKWTVVTADGKYSAHFEHTVAITDSGPLILSNGI